jgi:hypothetical protein
MAFKADYTLALRPALLLQWNVGTLDKQGDDGAWVSEFHPPQGNRSHGSGEGSFSQAKKKAAPARCTTSPMASASRTAFTVPLKRKSRANGETPLHFRSPLDDGRGTVDSALDYNLLSVHCLCHGARSIPGGIPTLRAGTRKSRAIPGSPKFPAILHKAWAFRG